MFGTKGGTVKKTALSAYANIRNAGRRQHQGNANRQHKQSQQNNSSYSQNIRYVLHLLTSFRLFTPCRVNIRVSLGIRSVETYQKKRPPHRRPQSDMFKNVR
jgi:hypothetical protein